MSGASEGGVGCCSVFKALATVKVAWPGGDGDIGRDAKCRSSKDNAMPQDWVSETRSFSPVYFERCVDVQGREASRVLHQEKAELQMHCQGLLPFKPFVKKPRSRHPVSQDATDLVQRVLPGSGVQERADGVVCVTVAARVGAERRQDSTDFLCIACSMLRGISEGHP